MKIILPDDGSVLSPEVETGVVVTGATRPGDFVPEVNCMALTVNDRKALPTPRSLTLEQALTGAEYVFVSIDSMFTPRLRSRPLM